MVVNEWCDVAVLTYREKRRQRTIILTGSICNARFIVCSVVLAFLFLLFVTQRIITAKFQLPVLKDQLGNRGIKKYLHILWGHFLGSVSYLTIFSIARVLASPIGI